MRVPRFSIAGLMAVVLVASLGLAALRSGSEVWAGATLLAACGVLTLAVVGASCRAGAERAWWLGFALFGWGYLTLVFWSGPPWHMPPMSTLLEALRSYFRPPVPGKGYLRIDGYLPVAHCLMSLVAATLGGLLSLVLFGGTAARPVDLGAEPRPETRAPRRWWRRPEVVGLASLLVAASVVLVGLRWAPGLWAASVSLATWGILALAVVGAVFGRERRRAAWLGAALFGIGYMALIFAREPDPPKWPRVATDQLLNALRPMLPWVVTELPSSSKSVIAANTRILKILDRPIAMSFANETPLEDVLKSIKSATAGPNDTGIPIYIDPIGLQEAEKTMTSPIAIDLEGVPLRTSLRLALKQLGMDYTVMDGVLLISNEQGQYLPTYADPFLVVGHCLLALFAAGLGGWLAPIIAVPRGVGESR